MRVLVTGGSGYIGSSVVRDLARRGDEVIIYDNLSTGHRSLSKGFELIEGDIADRDRIIPCLKRVDAVMHFAASAYVAESVANPRKYFRNNVESALALMDCVLECGIEMFVFSSSCAVYGVPKVLPIVETSSKEPINPYGATKLFFERVLSAYSAAHGIRYVALRYFNAAGAHPSGEVGEIHVPETHLVPLAVRAAFGSAPPLTVFGNQFDTRDGTCIRDFIHVGDLGSAHLRALQYLTDGGESVALNLGTGKGTSVAEILQAIEETCGKAVPHTFAAARSGDPPVLYAAPYKAREVLGWEAQFDLKQIVSSAVKWEEKLTGVLSEL